MTNKKIAIIGVKGLPAFGGSARAGENMVEILKEKYNFTIYSVSSHTDRTTGYYNGYYNIIFKTFFIKSLNIFMYYIKSMLHCLFKCNYDIIHVFHIDGAFIIPFLKLKYKVIAGHRARPQESSKWNFFAKFYFHLMEIIFYKIPAHIITSVSKPIIDSYQEKTKRKIFYIPNGILLKNNNNLPDIKFKDYILFAAGRIMLTKGCHTMLKALNKINCKKKIIIIGNLKHEPQYKKILLELSSNLDVKFIDLIKEKRLLMSYIKNARFAVYPTFLEAMSNMLLEFASMKTPIICSDIPENTIIFDQNESLHFKSQDPNDLSEKITWALNNPVLMEKKADLAYKKIEDVFNWEKIAIQYSNLYDSLIH